MPRDLAKVIAQARLLRQIAETRRSELAEMKAEVRLERVRAKSEQYRFRGALDRLERALDENRELLSGAVQKKDRVTADR